MLMLCCCSVAVYIGFSYLTNAPKRKEAAAPRKVKSSRPKVGSSRRNDFENDDGVCMSNLLSASDIEDRLT